MHRFIALVPLTLLTLASPAFAQLDLTLTQVTDLTPLGFYAPGGGAFDPVTQKLWVADASSTTNTVVEIDPLTGLVSTTLLASIIPGFSGGPDAMALEPGTGNLFLFSAFGVDECGSISQTGQLILDLPTSNAASGAAFDAAGQLFVFSDNSSQLHRMDPSTSALLTSVTLQNFTGRVSAMAFDPATGRLVVLADTNDSLIEFNSVTGARLGGTSLAPFGFSGNFPGLIAFNGDGSRLFVAKGSIGGDLFVFDRNFPAEPFCFGDGSGAICPCGNLGAAREGCANSTGAGANLAASGFAQVGADSLVLKASQTPAGVFGVFFGGGAEITPALFGDGLRCVGGGIQRLGAPLATTAGGLAQSAVSISGVEGLVGGETRHYQFWYRDTLGPCSQGFNVSQGVKLVWQ